MKKLSVIVLFQLFIIGAFAQTFWPSQSQNEKYKLFKAQYINLDNITLSLTIPVHPSGIDEIVNIKVYKIQLDDHEFMQIKTSLKKMKESTEDKNILICTEKKDHCELAVSDDLEKRKHYYYYNLSNNELECISYDIFPADKHVNDRFPVEYVVESIQKTSYPQYRKNHSSTAITSNGIYTGSNKKLIIESLNNKQKFMYVLDGEIINSSKLSNLNYDDVDYISIDKTNNIICIYNDLPVFNRKTSNMTTVQNKYIIPINHTFDISDYINNPKKDISEVLDSMSFNGDKSRIYNASSYTVKDGEIIIPFFNPGKIITIVNGKEIKNLNSRDIPYEEIESIRIDDDKTINKIYINTKNKKFIPKQKE